MAEDEPFDVTSDGNWTSPSDLMDDAKDRKLSSIWKQGIGAWLLTVSTSAILGIQAVVELFVLTPLELGITIINKSVDAIILTPLGTIQSGADQTDKALSNMSILGLPVSVVVVLGTFIIVGIYLRRPSTSDWFPGSFMDFIGGAEESDED